MSEQNTCRDCTHAVDAIGIAPGDPGYERPNQVRLVEKVILCPRHAAVDALEEALMGTVCSSCGHRIGWNKPHDDEQTQLGRSNWAKCRVCREARAALALSKGTQTEATS
jgi:hypothetical protein